MNRFYHIVLGFLIVGGQQFGSVVAVAGKTYTRNPACWYTGPKAPARWRRPGWPYWCQFLDAGSKAERRYWLMKGAKKGIGEMMYLVGHAHYIGKYGFSENWAKYRFWTFRAARANWPAAQFSLAQDYWSHRGALPRDPVKARYWLSRAAEKEWRAKLVLSLYYRLGVAGKRNVAKADQLIAEALAAIIADRRKWKKPRWTPAEIYFRLANHAMCVYVGPLDIATSRQFLRRAAARGHAMAKRLLELNVRSSEQRENICNSAWGQFIWE